MKTSRATSSIIFLLLLVSCSLQLPKITRVSSDQRSVRQSFEAYKYALLNNLGKEAADLISTKTIQHYEQLRTWTLTASSKELKSIDPFDRLAVLALRHNIPPALLPVMSAKDIFGYGVKEDWVAKSTVAPYEIGTINVYGDYAVTNLLYWDQSTDGFIEFHKEGGIWRLNILPLLEKTRHQFVARLNSLNVNENKEIISIIESMSGRNVGDKIWTAPQPKRIAPKKKKLKKK